MSKTDMVLAALVFAPLVLVGLVVWLSSGGDKDAYL